MNYFVPILSFIVSFVCIFLILVVIKLKRVLNQLKNDVEYKEYELVKLYTESTTLIEKQSKDINDMKVSSQDLLKEAVATDTKFKELVVRYGEIIIEAENLKSEVVRWKDEANKSLSHRKSSEVRVGKIAENFAPFLSNFSYNPKNCHFLGMPIDFIVFDENGVHFVEVKSGNSALSSVQRKIRDDISNGKVSFELFRINEADDEQ